MTLSPETLAQDAAEAAVPTEDGLEQVSQLAQRQVDLEDELARLEAQAAELKREYEKLRTQLLPAALAEYGLTEIRMADGARVTVDAIIRASIPKARQGEAFAWLEGAGHGDLIKHVVSASFGRGEDDDARHALDALAALGVEPEDRRSVHAQTLSAFVREQTEAGVALPDELLGVFRGELTKIKRPRK